MDDHPSNSQEGYEFADDMLQLLGGNPGQLTLPQSMDFSALPHLQTLTQQPSLGLLQQQTALQISSWPARGAAGGFTGPPVETGATLPYREPSRCTKYGQKSLPVVGVSRSVTSGARQIQSSLQALNPQLIAPSQLAIPSQAPPEDHSQTLMPTNTVVAEQLAQAPAQGSSACQLSGLPTKPPILISAQHSSVFGPNVSASSGGTACLDFDLSVDAALACSGCAAGFLNIPPHMLMASPPLQNFVLKGGDQAGASAHASEPAPLTQALDSLKSTASRLPTEATPGSDMEAANSRGGLDNPSAYLTSFKDDPDASVGDAQPQADAERHQPVGKAFETERRNSHSNQSTRCQEQLEAGPSGSDGYHYAWDEGIAGKDMPDGGSDSADASSKDGKRGREGSCDLGQEGSEDSPNPRLKKIKVQIGADTQTAPDGRKQTETERRRIRRRVTNRESAKRIREKREEQMTVMSQQVVELEAHKAALMGHMHSVEDCCAQLMEQLKALKEKWCATCVENVKLYKKIFELRKALHPGATSAQLAGRVALDEEPVNLPAAVPVPTALAEPAADRHMDMVAAAPGSIEAAHGNTSPE